VDVAATQQAIYHCIDPDIARRVELQFESVVDSTNERLRVLAAGGMARHGQVLVAGQQSAGRGRLGRQWESPAGANLYLSLAWRIGSDPAPLEGLSLAVGCAVAEQVESRYGVSVRLKWPNDLYIDQAKCGGVLIELVSDPQDDWWAIVGLGLNVAMSPAEARNIGQAWTDLASHASQQPTHDRVAGLAVDALMGLLEPWSDRGFAAWQVRWTERDLLLGEQIQVQQPGRTVRGRAAGIDASGALCVETDTGRIAVQAGDATLLRGAAL